MGLETNLSKPSLLCYEQSLKSTKEAKKYSPLMKASEIQPMSADRFPGQSDSFMHFHPRQRF